MDTKRQRPNKNRKLQDIFILIIFSIYLNSNLSPTTLGYKRSLKEKIGSIGLQTKPQILYINGFTAVISLNSSFRDG